MGSIKTCTYFSKAIILVIGILIGLVTLLGTTGTVRAQTTLTEDQIQSIITLLESFDVNQTIVDNVDAAIRGEESSGTSRDTSTIVQACNYTFTRNLALGDRGPEVQELQEFLNTDPDTQIRLSGGGSPGNETQYFGSLTAAAVSRFQEKYSADILAPIGLSAGTGYWGSSSREKADELCAQTPQETDSVAQTASSLGNRATVATITEGSQLNVRSTPNGSTVGQQNDGASGTIIDGPIESGGYTWWHINYDSGVDGWSADSFLAITEPTTQTANGGTTQDDDATSDNESNIIIGGGGGSSGGSISGGGSSGGGSVSSSGGGSSGGGGGGGSSGGGSDTSDDTTDTDTTAPTISLSGSANMTLAVGDSYSDPGYSATDDVDGDITGDVVVAGDTVDTGTASTYTVTYNVTDSAGNTANEKTRTVTVEEADVTTPTISLSGSTSMTLTVGDSYSDPGYSATDNVDGDITDDVVVGGNTVDTSTAGTYTVTYNVNDSAGNAADEKTRTVTVEAEEEVSNVSSSIDVGTLPNELASVLQFPTEPTTDTAVSVTNASEFEAAAAQSGTQINVDADINQTVYISANDIDIHLNGNFVKDIMFCDSNKTCKGDWSSGSPVAVGSPVHRIRVIGPGTVGSLFTMVPLGDANRFNQDLIIDNVTIDTQLTGAETAIDLRGIRVAVVDSNVFGEEFAISGQGSSESVRPQDIIIANNTLNAFALDVTEGVKNEATVRLTHGDRIVFVDNVAQNGREETWSDVSSTEGNSKHVVRYHGDQSMIYFGRNTILNSGSMFPDFGGAQGHIEKIWVEDNTFYQRSAGRALTLNMSEGGTIGAFIANGNVEYKDGAEGWNLVRPSTLDEIVASGGTHDVQNNEVHNWQLPQSGWLPTL